MPSLGQRTDSVARFIAKVHFTDECWEWTGACNQFEYGNFTPGDKKVVKAHRYAWETFVGPIPEGLVIDHLCKNHRCVNPDHLEPVTQMENIRRGIRVQRQHCVNGHERTPENTYTDRDGRRRCRACSLEMTAARREDRPYRGSYTRPDVPQKTHCKHGHAFDEVNTLISSGKKHCRTCMRIRAARYAAQKKAA